MAGLFLLLMLYRVGHWRGLALSSPLVLVGLAIVAGLLTAAVEFAWYGLATGIPPLRVLSANLQFSYEIRPAWWVLAVGLGAAIVACARPYLRREAETGREAGGASGGGLIQRMALAVSPASKPR